MPISPNDVMRVATTLQAAANDEASQRSALSRAYYAALLEAETTFDVPERQQGESSHEVIIRAAVNYGKSSGRGCAYASIIGKWLPALRRSRNQADYRMKECVSDEDVERVVERAKKILEHCSDIKRLKSAQL